MVSQSQRLSGFEDRRGGVLGRGRGAASRRADRAPDGRAVAPVEDGTEDGFQGFCRHRPRSHVPGGEGLSATGFDWVFGAEAANLG